MQTFALGWLELRAAQQRLRETFEQSSLPGEASWVNSSPTVEEPDSEKAVRDVGSISPEATFNGRRYAHCK